MSRHCFIGSPLFGLTIFTTAPGDLPAKPNPTARVLYFEHGPSGESWLWLGQRVCLAYEPRRLRPASPLFIVE